MSMYTIRLSGNEQRAAAIVAREWGTVAEWMRDALVREAGKIRRRNQRRGDAVRRTLAKAQDAITSGAGRTVRS